MSRCLAGLDVCIGAAKPRPRENAPFVIGTVDILGGGKKYLVLHIDNPGGLVAKEKGSGMAWLTSTLVPDFVESKIYDEVKKKMTEEFKAKGSSVSIDITEMPPKGETPKNDLLTGLGIGALATSVGFALLYFLKLRRR